MKASAEADDAGARELILRVPRVRFFIRDFHREGVVCPRAVRARGLGRIVGVRLVPLGAQIDAVGARDAASSDKIRQRERRKQTAVDNVLQNVRLHQRPLNRVDQLDVAPRGEHPVLPVARHLAQVRLVGGTQPIPHAEQSKRLFIRPHTQPERGADGFRQRDEKRARDFIEAQSVSGVFVDFDFERQCVGPRVGVVVERNRDDFIRRKIRMIENARGDDVRQRFGQIRQRSAVEQDGVSGLNRRVVWRRACGDDFHLGERGVFSGEHRERLRINNAFAVEHSVQFRLFRARARRHGETARVLRRGHGVQWRRVVEAAYCDALHRLALKRRFHQVGRRFHERQRGRGNRLVAQVSHRVFRRAFRAEIIFAKRQRVSRKIDRPRTKPVGAAISQPRQRARRRGEFRLQRNARRDLGLVVVADRVGVRRLIV